MDSLLIHMALMLLTVAVSVIIAIKYDEYERYIIYYLDSKTPSLVYDPVDGEWEFLRKVRFNYIETAVEKDEEKEARRTLACTPTEELSSKGALKHVYEVPHPEHVLIKMQHNIVYDVVDKVFYMFQNGIADAYVYYNGG